MRSFTAFLLILAILAVAVCAQTVQDPNIEYDETNTAIKYIYSFRVPLSTANAALAAVPTGCAADKGYIARGSAWIEIRKPIEEGSRPTYAKIVSDLSTETCVDLVNTDVTTWVQNYVNACKFQTACGGSSACSCAKDQECTSVYDTDGTLTETDFCEPGYICSTTPEAPVGKCTYARIPFKLTAYNQTFTEPLFYTVARSSTCSSFGLTMAFNLADSRNLYFSALSESDVSEACLDSFSTKFGGVVSPNADTSCQSTCGGAKCICETGNLCALSWDEKSKGNKQCANKLKCGLVNGNAICNNSVIFSAAFAIACAFIAVLM